MATGTVDVRTREEKDNRLGKMRVDELIKMFESLLPKRSKNYEEIYNKVWRPEDFPVKELPPKEKKPKEDAKEESKKEESKAE